MFERLIILLAVLVTMPVAAEDLDLKKDAYGPGVHSDQYGSPWKSEPGLELKKNTYGLGIHADQYGRPSETATQSSRSSLTNHGQHLICLAPDRMDIMSCLTKLISSTRITALFPLPR